MAETQLITIGLLFLFSVIGGILAGKFKQPIVLGLMLIGALIGPHLLNIVSDQTTIDLMIEFGAILFLFVMGLEFSMKKLLKTGAKSILVTAYKVGIMFFIGFTTIMVLGFDSTTAAFIGVALSFSSTMIIMNILKQKNLIKRKEVPLLLAVLVIEDIFGVFALTFFAAVKESGASGLFAGIEQLVLSLFILVGTYLLFAKFSEKIVNWLTKQAGEEIIPFIALGLCSGFAYLAYFLQLSPSAGAFLAGSVVSTFKESKIFEHSIKPHSLMFTSFFFISMGTIIDFKAVIDNWFVILILYVLIIASLFVAVGLSTRIFAGFKSSNAIFGSLAMMPPGVFSLLVAKESVTYGVGLDIVSVVSVLIFMLAITMSFALKYISKVNDHVVVKRATGINAKIEKLSAYVSNFFAELDLEHSYTRKFKRNLKKATFNMLGILVVVVLTLKVIELYVVMILAKYALFILVLGGIGFLGYKAHLQIKEANYLAIKILAGLEGGTRVKVTKRIIKNLKIAISIFVIGLFSPLALFVIKAEILYLIPSFILVMVGAYFFLRTANLMGGVSMDYKYSIHEYKKMGIKGNWK